MKAPCAVGIDVAGKAKGFHAVALIDGRFEPFASKDTHEVAKWCLEHQPAVVAVDSPCSYAIGNQRSRQSERELRRVRINSYSTPCKSLAEGRPFYDWVRIGFRLYRALEEASRSRQQPVSIVETFPHAVACSLVGEVFRKSMVRRSQILGNLGYDLAPLSNDDDLIDAALCAVAAKSVADGTNASYGRVEDGVIVTPPWATATKPT